MSIPFRAHPTRFLLRLLCLGLICLASVPPAWSQGKGEGSVAAGEAAPVENAQDDAGELEDADVGEIEDEDEAPESSPSRLLRLGPLPVAKVAGVQGELAPLPALVPELDPLRTRPEAGDEVLLASGRPSIWREVPAQTARTESEGVVWLAVYPRFVFYGEYEIEVDGPGAIALYLDGELLAEREGDEPEDLGHTLTLRRGRSCLLVRIQGSGGDPARAVEIEISGEHAASIDWSTDPRFAPSRYEQSRDMAWYSGLAVASMGRSIARRVERYAPQGDETIGNTCLMTRTSTVQATLLDGDEATPLFFAKSGRELVLRRGDDLVLWPMPQGHPRVLVHDEPGWTAVEPSPDASYFLLTSRRGAELPEPDEDAPLRQSQLRARVPDYVPGDGLHLVESATGARRQLTLPGDSMIDDAIFLPQHASVLYVRVLPQEERPWFRSEFRRIDLQSGDETLVAEFVAGWEVRPDDLCLSPDGLRVAFTGPPEPIGEGHGEHNVYNRALWTLDLISGEMQRVLFDEGWSLNAAHDLGVLSWMDDQTLLTVLDAGSGHEIVRVMGGSQGWSLRRLEYEGEVLSRASLSSDHSVLAYVAQSRDRAPNLRLMDLNQAREFGVEDPNEELPWKISTPQDAAYEGPGGETIEGWWYAPTVPQPPMSELDGGRTDSGELEAARRTPLIVYYYGGASPTSRSFSTTFQWLCANGYAVLVLQTRGAYGWGDEFADHHAGDWGPKAGADVLAGVKQFLAQHAEIDPRRVGIFGGSYGGYLTNWLLTRTQDFAAAVSYYGISDVASYWGDGDWGLTYGDMSVAGRTPYSDAEYFLEHSPFRDADAIQTPLLLMHGLADQNVRPEESMQLFTALRSQGKPVEMVLFPGEVHGIASTLSARARQRGMMMDWFDFYLRGETEAWTQRWEKE